MRNRLWIAAVSLLLALPSKAELRDKLKNGGEKKETMEEQFRTCIKQKAWIAYFRSDDGELAPVRDTLNTDNDEEWIGLRFTEYEGPRIRLGVLRVINKSAEAEENGSGRIEVPVAGIQEILTQSLYATRRFDVIEQKRVNEIVDQQTRQDLQEPSPFMISEEGQVLRAQYLVYGTVNEWTPERASHKAGPGSPFMAGKKEAEVSITFNLADVATGQVLFITTERARIGEWSFDLSSSNGGRGGTQQNTPVGYAVRACVNKAAFKIATYLRNRKWKGSVVAINSNDIYINAGSQQGMAPKMMLTLLTVRGMVWDEESRTFLGEDLVASGTVEVIAVQNGFSIAQEVPGNKKAKIKVGDRVELATDPVLPPKIRECDALDTSQVL